MKICEKQLVKLTGTHTAKTWFEWARDNGYPWAQSALNQCDLGYRTKSLANALDYSMLWSNTAEGEEYWDNIYDKLLNENM